MCTEFFLKTAENNLISGRTFDFPFDPLYSINCIKKNDSIFLLDQSEKEYFYGYNKYNYMHLYCFNNKDMIADGMNEEGLIVNVLWLEDTVYGEKNNQSEMIFFLDIPKIILSQCKNISEVKDLLKSKIVWNKPVLINQTNNIIGKLHYSVHDKNHDSVIIEIKNGAVSFTENELQVITNQPHYYWHEKNIDNYLHLTNKTISNKHTNKKSFHTNVNGNGLVGIPGDYTSISRFVKIQKLISFIPEKKHNDKDTIAIVDKIIGNVSIPQYGMIEEKNDNEIMAHSYYTIIKNQNKLEWYIKKDLEINYSTCSMEYFQ
jgi:penicillin V acylase-like amidase (Ntn superfamily)